MLTYSFFLKINLLSSLNSIPATKTIKFLTVHTSLVSHKIWRFMSEKPLFRLLVPSPSLRDLLLRKPRYYTFSLLRWAKYLNARVCVFWVEFLYDDYQTYSHWHLHKDKFHCPANCEDCGLAPRKFRVCFYDNEKCSILCFSTGAVKLSLEVFCHPNRTWLGSTESKTTPGKDAQLLSVSTALLNPCAIKPDFTACAIDCTYPKLDKKGSILFRRN